MWWCDRRAVLIAALALAGCGFEPSFGPEGAAQGLRGTVLIDDPGNRDAYLLTRRIEDRLGRSDAPRYGLTLTVSMTEELSALTATNFIERYKLVGAATWVLRDLGTGAVLAQDQTSSFTGYSTTGTTVATLAAARDARERLAVIMADQIVAQLLTRAPSLPE